MCREIACRERAIVERFKQEIETKNRVETIDGVLEIKQCTCVAVFVRLRLRLTHTKSCETQ